MRAFDKERDTKVINGWLLKRDKTLLDNEAIPNFGMIEDDVACGFMCLTDTDTILLEAFISNPDAESIERDKAIRKIANWVIATATALGYKQALFLTKEEGFVSRAKEFGFDEVPIKLFKKKL